MATSNTLLILGLLAVSGSLEAQAVEYYGRAMAGALLSSEQSKDTSDPTVGNDSSIVSSRLSARILGLSSYGFEGNLDLRDKNDFFEKLDREKLQLTSGNQFQVQQLNARLPAISSRIFGTVGRFSLPETGGKFSDGLETGYRWNDSWRTAIFGGLNPKLEEQTFVTYNPDSQILGTYTSYQPQVFSSSQSAFWSTAWVGERTAAHLDRLFWFNEFIFHYSNTNQLIAMGFFDFIPRFEIQTALLSWHQELMSHWSSQLNLTAIDVIEYSRRKGILETLPSSPYREAALSLRRQWGEAGFFDFNGSYGLRDLDSLAKIEFSAGPSFYRVFDPNISFKLLEGARRNFISNDLFTRIGGSYFGKTWEVDVDFGFSRVAENDGATKHQWINEIAYSHYFGRELLASLSLEQARDEQTSIWSGSVRVSYSFGQRSFAPLPQQAPPPSPIPPMGRL
ncbi:hypothetical protein WDW86_06435 [Bdellovibrionota bacterium FG-2]